MGKGKVSKIFTKLLTDLYESDYSVEIGWIDKDTEGHVDVDNDKICINTSLLIVKVYIHELVHIKKDRLRWDEKGVEDAAFKIIHEMSEEEVRWIAEQIIEAAIHKKRIKSYRNASDGYEVTSTNKKK